MQGTLQKPNKINYTWWHVINPTKSNINWSFYIQPSVFALFLQFTFLLIPTHMLTETEVSAMFMKSLKLTESVNPI